MATSEASETCPGCGTATAGGSPCRPNCGIATSPYSPVPSPGERLLPRGGSPTLRQRLVQQELGRQIGHFRLLDLLGVGGFATVFRAEDMRLGRKVAIKLLHVHLAQDSAFVRRFENEARAAARLRHPHIVRIHEVAETDDGRPYLVMELLQGTLLSQLIRRSGPLAPDQAMRIIGQLADAIDYLHRRQTVHRDIKPSNVMVSESGDATLMDFGIARSLEDEARLTQPGQLLGTPVYMAPEQISSGQTVPASDIYSLGILAYEVLAGCPPFTGTPASVIRDQLQTPPPSVERFNPALPDTVSRALQKVLAKDPYARPETAAMFLSDLLDHRSAFMAAGSVGEAEPAARARRSHGL
ncbi:MAG: serine/threonine-protein kinase, partial [Dehalococcoidia bacterium]